MQHKIGRRADGKSNSQRVFYRVLTNDIPGPYAVVNQTDDRPAGLHRLLFFLRSKWRGRSRHGQPKAKGLHDAAHRIRRA
ncbi:hypothetical protein SDC9_162711 [bioreactor metagenome]|uniref:Uncharacterized protein n=1 Tax=bioreactor metagenome TaxID=1076179 RepID=A0A645FPT5_9ZZZZ